MTKEIAEAINHLLLSISDDAGDYTDQSLFRQINDAADRLGNLVASIGNDAPDQ